MDLSGISDADLRALSSGDMSKVSQAGLQILSQKQAAPKPPVEDPGMLQSMLIGAGRTFDRIGKGAQQMYYGTKAAFEQPTVTSLITGMTPSQQKLAELKRQAENDDEVYNRLKTVRPYSTGIGESLPSMVIPAGGGATLGANMLRMGIAGAAPAALEYGSIEDRAKNALWNGVAGAVVPVGVAAAKTGKAILEPFYKSGQEAIVSRVLGRAAGDDLPNVLPKLQNAQPLVPGSMPTAAQVAENGGVAALERAAGQAYPAPYAQRAMEQSAARVNAVRGIAKDDAALQAAIDARTAATKPLYQQATSAQAPLDAELNGILQRTPDRVFGDAKETSRLFGSDFTLQPQPTPTRNVNIELSRPNIIAPKGEGGAPRIGDPTEINVSRTIPVRGPKQPYGAAPQVVNPNTVSGNDLHYLKLAIDDTLQKGAAPGGLGSTQSAGFNSLQGDLLGFMDKNLPGYQVARNTFADMSKPINQMQVGQTLLNKVQPALADFGALGKETGATYANALRNADKTAADATGRSGAKLADVMTPEQMATLDNVAKDLARKSNAQELGRGVGSNTFQNLAMDNLAHQSGMPSLSGGLLNLPGVNHVMNWATKHKDAEIQGLLADALLNPQQTAALISKTQPKLLADNPLLRKVAIQSAMRSGLLAPPVAAGAAQQ